MSPSSVRSGHPTFLTRVPEGGPTQGRVVFGQSSTGDGAPPDDLSSPPLQKFS